MSADSCIKKTMLTYPNNKWQTRTDTNELKWHACLLG